MGLQRSVYVTFLLVHGDTKMHPPQAKSQRLKCRQKAVNVTQLPSNLVPTQINMLHCVWLLGYRHLVALSICVMRLQSLTMLFNFKPFCLRRPASGSVDYEDCCSLR